MIILKAIEVFSFSFILNDFKPLKKFLAIFYMHSFVKSTNGFLQFIGSVQG